MGASLYYSNFPNSQTEKRIQNTEAYNIHENKTQTFHKHPGYSFWYLLKLKCASSHVIINSTVIIIATNIYEASTMHQWLSEPLHIKDGEFMD